MSPLVHEVVRGVVFVCLFVFCFNLGGFFIIIIPKYMKLVLVTLHHGEENFFCILQILWNLLELALKLDTWSIKNIYIYVYIHIYIHIYIYTHTYTYHVLLSRMFVL